MHLLDPRNQPGVLEDPTQFQLPYPMATTATEVDNQYLMIFWISVAFTVVIGALIIYWSWVYRRQPGRRAAPVGHNLKLELVWTILPLFAVTYLFHEGFRVWVKNAVAAENSLEVRVKGHQWAWSFEYVAGGQVSDNVLVLPINKPVKLILSSSDVIHSFFVPNFRIKRDAVPGSYSTISFTPNVLGEVQAFCAEYCGATAPVKDTNGNDIADPHAYDNYKGHATMYATVKVVSDDEFKKTLDALDNPVGPPEEIGKKLVTSKQCTSCHSQDGSRSPAPSFKGLWGSQQPIIGQGTVTVDENYVRESILKPQAKIVEGYTSIQMPMIDIKEKQIDAIIAYMKTLK